MTASTLSCPKATGRTQNYPSGDQPLHDKRVLQELEVSGAPKARAEIRSHIQNNVLQNKESRSPEATDSKLQDTLKALSNEQSEFKEKVLEPARMLTEGAKLNLISHEKQLKDSGFIDWVSGHKAALEEVGAVYQKDATNQTAHSAKLEARYHASLETKQAAEEMLETARTVESQGLKDEAAVMRTRAAELLNQAKDALKGLKSMDAQQAAETIAGLQKINQRLDAVIQRSEVASTAASVVKEAAHVAGVGVGFALGGPTGGGLVNQGMRMIESAAEEGMHIVLSNKSREEAGRDFLHRSRDAVVESGITAVSGAIGQRVGTLVQKLQGPVLAKAVDIVSSGTIQSAGTAVQLGYEFTKAHHEFENAHSSLVGPDRDKAYAEYMSTRGFALDDVSKRLGASFAAGAGAKGVFHVVSRNPQMRSDISAHPSSPVVPVKVEGARHTLASAGENLTGNLGEVVGNGQPISVQTIIPALVGGHLSQVGVQSAGAPHGSRSSAETISETTLTDSTKTSHPKSAPASEAVSAPPSMRAIPDAVPSKTTGPAVDYSLPDSVKGIMKNPRITTKNAVILVQHEGRLLYGLRREGLDAAGTWSVISGAMEAKDAHPIDAALRELGEETAYSGQFKSIKVIGGIVDKEDPTTASLYVVAEAHEAFVPSPHAQDVEHVEWRWAPAAQCPWPAHPKMQQTQELFFESAPAEHLVPADGRLSAVHGTASWFPQFSLGNIVNGNIYGAGVYCGLLHSQGPEYASRSQKLQTPLHGKYVYKLDISTNIHNGGYESVNKAATDAFLDHTVRHLRAQKQLACDRLADKIKLRHSDLHGMSAAAIAGLYAEAAGISFKQAHGTLSIQGKWVPGFCYVAFNPSDVTILERTTITPPASPQKVLAHSETKMKEAFHNSLGHLRDLRAALSWATKGELGEQPGTLSASIRDRAHADDLVETIANRYRSAVLEVARRNGLDKLEAQYVTLHEREINDIRSALGSEVTRRMWAEQFPEKMPGKIARLLIDHPEIAHDPEMFVKMAAEVLQPDGHESWKHTRDSVEFAWNHQKLLQTIWLEMSKASDLYPRDTPSVLSARASKTARDERILEGILQQKLPEDPGRMFREAINILKVASSNGHQHQSLSESIIDTALNSSERSRLRFQAPCRLALQIAESLKPGTALTDLPSLPSFLPQAGTLARFFARQQINRWLSGHDISPSDISAAAPTVNKVLQARCVELAQEHDRAQEAKATAQSQFDEFVVGARRLVQRGQEFTIRASERASEFEAAVLKVGINGPVCCVAAAAATLPCGLSLEKAGSLARNYKSLREMSRLNEERELETALSYFRSKSPSERALAYAHETSIMDRTDLHPSWTGELLESLNKHSTVHILDDEAVREASRFVSAE
jgi:8-oxo-dGTP pyrophosphatase MutT (NUDIX family)